jgi:hypothetical protein
MVNLSQLIGKRWITKEFMHHLLTPAYLEIKLFFSTLCSNLAIEICNQVY